MAQKLGPNYEVEVNALGGRTVKRDQKDGNGTGKSLSGKLFNGMVSLPAVLSENLPLDIVIVMLGTNDANSRYKNNAKAIADDLEEMIRMIQAGEWQSNTKFKTPKVLVIAPPLQPNETAYDDAFSGAEKNHQRASAASAGKMPNSWSRIHKRSRLRERHSGTD